MSTFAFLMVCVQACLIQAVYSHCGCGSYPTANSATAGRLPGTGSCGPISAEGTGNVAFLGELGVAGSTLVSGQVPVLGAVQFNGPLPASGTVTISGTCACGC